MTCIQRSPSDLDQTVTLAIWQITLLTNIMLPFNFDCHHNNLLCYVFQYLVTITRVTHNNTGKYTNGDNQEGWSELVLMQILNNYFVVKFHGISNKKLLNSQERDAYRKCLSAIHIFIIEQGCTGSWNQLLQRACILTVTVLLFGLNFDQFPVDVGMLPTTINWRVEAWFSNDTIYVSIGWLIR